MQMSQPVGVPVLHVSSKCEVKDEGLLSLLLVGESSRVDWGLGVCDLLADEKKKIK